MKATNTDIPGVIIVEPQVFGDDRGWFTESYSNLKMGSIGIKEVFVQDNHSSSAIKGTLRGLHFQKEPEAQTKLVRCTRGAIFDVAVDIRKGSPTYLRWISMELSAKNFRMLYIPKGFAHGFLTLEDDTEVQYKVDNIYSKKCDRSIRFDDPQIGVKWGSTDVQLSEKDLKAPLLKDSDNDFIYL
jgi:dTDP-4-dehydrorhamnose 3,5-epimerase